MKKFVVSAAAVAIAFALSSASQPVLAQGGGGGGAQKGIPHKVGLIDMAHVFKNYKKFKELREGLKQEIRSNDGQIKGFAERMKNLKDQLQTYDKESQQYVNTEQELLKVSAEADLQRKKVQRELMRKESKIYRTVYLEVEDAVRKYAEYYGYTLIIRFNRQTVADAKSPPEVIQNMNRQVVYSRSEDDLTESVLTYLNKKYEASEGGATREARRPTGGSTR